MARTSSRVAAPITIDVASQRGDYPVVVGRGLSRRVRALLSARRLRTPPVVVSSPLVWRLHGARLKGLTAVSPPVLIPDGERAKTLATVSRVYAELANRSLDRTSTVVGFGGGVLGDTAGFAAATYLRGLSFVQIPTTLVAQVDSAVGGKVGVNLAAGKNLVGAFHPPAMVICDPSLLKTLPRREFRAGLYEVIKYGVIASESLFDDVATRLDAIFDQAPRPMTELIAACCRIKAAIVSEDEREGGPRRVLNFGHTAGHALEAITGYRRFRHGEAIGYGMMAAARLSALRGALAAADERRLGDLIRHLGPLPLVTDLRIDDAIDAMKRDKKMVGGRLHFVLATGIGSTTIVDDVTKRELRSALAALGMRR